MKGRGVPATKRPGDLLVTVEVAVPAKLSDRRARGGRGIGGGVDRVAARRSGGVAHGTANTSRAVYVISVAAELAGVHPQTLRIYERKGLVDPARTAGGSRRYSDADIERLHAASRS